jgi:hypothetical protein
MRGDQSAEDADKGHEDVELDLLENNVELKNNAPDRPFSVDTPSVSGECSPECDVTKNELCKETGGVYRCVCRPGFARIFQQRPCTREYFPNIDKFFWRLVVKISNLT